jgi:hypothetical protein
MMPVLCQRHRGLVGVLGIDEYYAKADAGRPCDFCRLAAPQRSEAPLQGVA